MVTSTHPSLVSPSLISGVKQHNFPSVIFNPSQIDSFINNNKMSNSSQLLSTSIAFSSSNQLQAPQHSPQSLNELNLQNSLANFQQPQQHVSRGKGKHNQSKGGNNLNGGIIGNHPGPPLFRTSVAFPSSNSSSNQSSPSKNSHNNNFSQQCRSNSNANQMQSHSSQLQANSVLSLPSLNLSSNNSSSQLANIIQSTSNNNAASAVAVAAANYVAAWPCPACKTPYRSANDLQTHLRYCVYF